jgi:hypothetical protein
MMTDSKTRVTRRLTSPVRMPRATTADIKVIRELDGITIHASGRMIFLSENEARAVSLELVRVCSLLDP